MAQENLKIKVTTDGVSKAEKDLSSLSNTVGGKSSGLVGSFIKAELVVGALSKAFDVMVGAGQAVLGFAAGSIDAFADFETQMVAVARTTGQSKDEAIAFGKALRNIETPTAFKDLNDIARIGGQLGIAVDELEGFVRAIDKVNVALGDEFAGGAEEIATVLGKLKGQFADVKGMKAEEAFTRIGSAINELGAAGAATGPNIAEFANRMGRVQSITKFTTPQVLALGATLEELGINAEISSGGLTRIFLAAGENTEIFAKKLGMTEKSFKNLFNTNPIGFLEELSKKIAGMPQDQAIQFLKDLKIGTQESVGVLLAMGQNTDLLGQKLTLANGAFQESTSVINEFNTSTDTLAANQAMVSKQFEDFSLQVGEGFIPVITQLQGALLPLMQLLSEKIAPLISGVVTGAFNLFREAIAGAQPFVDGIKAKLESLGNLIQQSGLGDTIRNVGAQLKEAFKESVRTSIQNLYNMIKTFVEYLATPAGKQSIEDFKGAIQRAADAIQSLWSGASKVQAKITELMGTMSKLANQQKSFDLTNVGILGVGKALLGGGGHDGGQITKIPGYATGGMVGGVSIPGVSKDNLLVRAEEGEAILNQRQQGNIMRQLDRPNNNIQITVNNGAFAGGDTMQLKQVLSNVLAS